MNSRLLHSDFLRAEAKPCRLSPKASSKLAYLTSLLLTMAVIIFGTTLLAAEKIPDELQGVGISESVGQKINLALTFNDEAGVSVPLQTYFSKNRPVLFFLVYYECPNLCTFVLNGAVDALKEIDKKPGKDFEVVALSFDPSETPSLATQKKAAYLTAYNHHETDEGWHFLTGSQKIFLKSQTALDFITNGTPSKSNLPMRRLSLC